MTTQRLHTVFGVVQVLETDKWHEVSAFQWLTGWPQENLLDPLHGPSLTVSLSQITLLLFKCLPATAVRLACRPDHLVCPTQRTSAVLSHGAITL